MVAATRPPARWPSPATSQPRKKIELLARAISEMSAPVVKLWLEILTGNSGALEFCENIQSSRVFYTDFDDIKIVALSQRGGGVDKALNR